MSVAGRALMVAKAHAPLPSRLHLELTNRCNSQCSTCVRTADPDPERDMALADVERMVAALPGLQSVALQVNGEPLLYPELPAVLRLLARRGVRVELNTNGIALDGPRAAALLENGLARLNVSLDAALPQTYRVLRGVDALERVIANTEQFLRRRGAAATPLVALWVTCTRHNLGEIPSVVELASRIGADEVYLQRLVYFGAGAATSDCSLHGRVGAPERAVIAAAVERAAQLGVALRACGGHDPIAMFDAGLETPDDCRRPLDSAVVMANGDVVPCCISTFVGDRDEIRMGNVGSDSWSSIWNGARYARFRSEHASGGGPSFCRGCGVDWSL